MYLGSKIRSGNFESGNKMVLRGNIGKSTASLMIHSLFSSASIMGTEVLLVIIRKL